jgi:hypothetical protein
MADTAIDHTLVADAIAASTAPRTYEIRHTPDHAYVKDARRGCAAPTPARCGHAKAHPVHHLPSLNTFGSGADHFAYQTAKHHWQTWLIEALTATGLPKPLDSILVEGTCCFPTRAPRDQGNHRYFIEKALGDALEAGGWLENDDWSRYEFGNLAFRYAKGERWTELRFFPNALQRDSQQQLTL